MDTWVNRLQDEAEEADDDDDADDEDPAQDDGAYRQHLQSSSGLTGWWRINMFQSQPNMSHVYQSHVYQI